MVQRNRLEGKSLSEPTKITNSKNEKEKRYQMMIKNFTELDAVAARTKLETGKSFFLYLGRKNCPYCQAFLPQLYKLSMTEKVDIYYMDTLNSKYPQLKSFYEDFGVKTVPSLYFISKGKAVKYSNEQNLLSFINEHKKELQNEK